MEVCTLAFSQTRSGLFGSIVCQICASPKPPLSYQVTHKLEDHRRNSCSWDRSKPEPKRQDYDQETAPNIRRTRDQRRNSRSWDRSRSEPKHQDHDQETTPNIRRTRGKCTNYATVNSALICCMTSLQHLEHKGMRKRTKKQQLNPIDNTPGKYANSSWSKFLQIYYCFHINLRFGKYRPQKACRSVACESGFLYFPDSLKLKILICRKPHNTTAISLSHILWQIHVNMASRTRRQEDAADMDIETLHDNTKQTRSKSRDKKRSSLEEGGSNVGITSGSTNSKDKGEKKSKQKLTISLFKDSPQPNFWFGFPTMELLAQKEGEDPIPQNSTIIDLVTMGLPKEEAEELTTTKMSYPRVLQKLWPSSREDGIEGQ